METLRKRLIASTPIEYRHATGLSQRDLSLNGLSAQWRSAGLERERVVLGVHRQHQAPCAFAVLEFATPGLHLYGLLDCARIVFLDPVPSPAEAPEEHALAQQACDALLSAAFELYAARGRSQFVYLRTFDSPAPSSDLGFCSMGTAQMSIFHRSWLGNFMEHVFQTLAPNLNQAPGIFRTSSIPPALLDASGSTP
jgi:hypothetical protein